MTLYPLLQGIRAAVDVMEIKLSFLGFCTLRGYLLLLLSSESAADLVRFVVMYPAGV